MRKIGVLLLLAWFPLWAGASVAVAEEEPLEQLQQLEDIVVTDEAQSFRNSVGFKFWTPYFVVF